MFLFSLQLPHILFIVFFVSFRRTISYSISFSSVRKLSRIHNSIKDYISDNSLVLFSSFLTVFIRLNALLNFWKALFTIPMHIQTITYTVGYYYTIEIKFLHLLQFDIPNMYSHLELSLLLTTIHCFPNVYSQSSLLVSITFNSCPSERWQS